jgi:hypothetical protein
MKKVRKPNAPEGWQEKFIEAYRQTGNISHAARTAMVDRTTVLHLRDRNKTFKACMEEAKAEALENLEYEAWRRAHNGVEKPVFYKGKVCGSIQEYSDTLMIVLLKGNAPDKYRENSKVEHSGPNGGAIPFREILIERAPVEERAETDGEDTLED